MITTKIKLKLTKPSMSTSDNLRHYSKQLSESGECDCVAGVCLQAADELESLHKVIGEMDDIIMQLERRLNEQEQFREDFSKHD